MLNRCEKAPDGRHCWHSPMTYYSYPPPSPTCCFCGAKERDQHGPHVPDDPRPIARLDQLTRWSAPSQPGDGEGARG